MQRVCHIATSHLKWAWLGLAMNTTDTSDWRNSTCRPRQHAPAANAAAVRTVRCRQRFLKTYLMDQRLAWARVFPPVRSSGRTIGTGCIFPATLPISRLTNWFQVLREAGISCVCGTAKARQEELWPFGWIVHAHTPDRLAALAARVHPHTVAWAYLIAVVLAGEYPICVGQPAAQESTHQQPGGRRSTERFLAGTLPDTFQAVAGHHHPKRRTILTQPRPLLRIQRAH